MIETTHQGYRIRYGENSDTWECFDLQLSANTLSSLKDKINKTLAEERKVGNVAVIRVGSSWSTRMEPGVLTLLDANGTGYEKKPAGWVMFTDAKGRKKREKIALDELVLDTPENRATMDSYFKERERIRKLEKAADATVEAMPRVTHERLVEMKKEK